MLKNAYFLKKTFNIASALRVLLPNPRWPLAAVGADSRIVTPACYYNFVVFFISAKFVLLPEKNNRITAESVLLLPNFCT